MGTDTEVLGSGAGGMQADGDEARETTTTTAGKKTSREKAGRGKFDAVWEEAELAYFGGATAPEVARRFGMSPQTVYAHMAGRGKRAVKLEQRRARVPEEAVAAGEGRKAPTTEALAMIMVDGLGELREQLIEATGLREAALEREDGTTGVRRIHGEEVWASARRDYEKGSFTAGRIADRYGMVESTIRQRAWKTKWDKRITRRPPPLLPPPDPKQIETVEGVEKSAWARIAFAPQLPPEGAWSTWLFQGGRGAGKTRAGAEWLAERAEKTPNGLFALVGPTQHDVREVMIGGVSGLRSLPGREWPEYESSRRRLTWDNGAVAYAFSAEEPERLRGPQFMAAWADEFCTWPKPAETLALLRMGLRLGDDPRLVVTTTPKPIVGLRKLRAEVSCVTTHAPSRINEANLTPTFLEGLEALYGGTKLARQELEGELLDGDGALWTREMIAKARGARPSPESGKFERVVVGVDPPAGAEGSVCGIVVVGLANGRGYVLEDASCVGATPAGWAGAVAQAAKRHGARKIIAEHNMGGDMVRTTLLGGGVTCAVELVHASEAKQARAQPVSALYEREQVTHCGDFPQLEEEMLTLGVAGLEKKLDRADALVWALTSLMITPRKPPPRIGLIG